MINNRQLNNSSLIIIKNSPELLYSANSTNSIDLLLMFSAFEQPIKVLFIQHGILNLIKNSSITMIESQFKLLELYDITQCYVLKDDLQTYQLSVKDLIINVQVKASTEIQNLMVNSQVVLTF